jgi:hypothetical protein
MPYCSHIHPARLLVLTLSTYKGCSYSPGVVLTTARTNVCAAPGRSRFADDTAAEATWRRELRRADATCAALAQVSRETELGGRVIVRRVTRDQIRNDVHLITSARVPPADMLTTNLSYSTQSQS